MRMVATHVRRSSVTLRAGRLVALVTALALLAACTEQRNDQDVSAPSDADAEVPSEAAGDAVVASFAVTGTNDLTFDPDQIAAPAGTIEFELTCDAAMHDLVISETGDKVAACMPGETDHGTVALDPGEYTFQCTVPGHARMTGTLTVE